VAYAVIYSARLTNGPSFATTRPRASGKAPGDLGRVTTLKSKRIGLIGGLSPESTVHYYEIICREYNRRAGGLNFPEISLDSLNLQQLVSLFEVNDWNGVASILLDSLHRLHRAGAEFAAILANTPHNAYELIRDVSPLRIITIMDATTASLGRDRRRQIALLGTRATMEYGFFQRHFQSHGIHALTPEAAQRRELDRIIWDELSHGVVSPESKATAAGLVDDLVSRGAEAVVLACTELSLMMKPEDYSYPFYDTTRLHAEAILEFAIKDPL
jgi:aspartate racemase